MGRTRNPQHETKKVLDSFKIFLSEKCLFQGSERVLLAVSGGVDSMVMAHVFRQAGIAHGIAHCNFQLRGEASDGDEQFVRRYAQERGILCFHTSFATEAIAERESESIQVAARRLRYEWLESIRSEEGYDFIATAHHLDDAAETLLYNLTKGCGIRGLHGIPVRRGHIIRPMLFAPRLEVEAYAREQGIAWREDASNSETYYTRNKIRHEVLPVLKAINPQFEKTMGANIQRFRDAEALFHHAVQDILRRVTREEPGGGISIRIDELAAFPAPASVLYELLRPYGFAPAQAAAVLDRAAGQAGAVFLSGAWRLLIDRDEAHLESIPEGPQEAIAIHQHTRSAAVPEGWFALEHFEGKPAVISAEPELALLDAHLLNWPLRLRRWQPGDYFHPFGMKGQRKKLQDFFTAEKLSRFDKEKVWIVETASGEICWVAGYRMDDRFRITPSTKQYLVLKYRKNDAPL